jgi:hypothetical protein
LLTSIGGTRADLTRIVLTEQRSADNLSDPYCPH